MKKFFLPLFLMLSMVVMLAPTVSAAETNIVLPDGVTAESFGANTVTDGTNYYLNLQAAVEAVTGNSGAVLYCKPNSDVGNLQHAPVTATLTVYGNGASVTGGAERDFDIGNTDPSGGKDITADMTLTVHSLNGCGAWGAKATNHTVSLVFNDCENMGKVFITGTVGTLNISITDCSFEGVIAEAVYSNSNGNIELTRVDFSNLNKAVNLNHKVAGTQNVVITDCTFTNCGKDVASDQIPVRVLSSVEGGNSMLKVSGCSFSGTPEGGADILLDYGIGTTSASISETSANLFFEEEENVATKTEVTTSDTVSFKNFEPVAKIGDDEYPTLQSAIDNAPDGAEIDIVASFALTSQDANPLMKPVYNRESYCGVYIPDDKKLTIDLNGNAITYVDEYYDCDNVMILNFGDLTINDSVGGGKISYKPVAGNTTYSYFYSTIFNCGKLTINAGTVENTCETATDVSNAVDNHSRLSHEYGNDCILIVNGGTLIGSEYRAIRQYTHYFEGVQNRVTINGGTVMGGIYMQHGDSWYYSDPSKNRLNVDCYLTINGGTITTIRCADGEDYGHIRSYCNNPDNNAWGLEINGGFIDVPVQLYVQRGVYYTNGVSGATTPAEATGTRNTEWLEENGGFISGGLFTDLGDPNDVKTNLQGFLVEGYIPFEMAPGEWGVAVEGADVTVTYDGYYSVTVVAGTVISKFTPDNDGYELVGWYTEPEFVNKFDFSRPIIESVTLYPCWKDDKHDIDTGYVMIIMKMLEKLDISVEIIEAEGGKIVVVVPEKVKYNKPAVCTVIPDEGYAIKDVIVDGESVGAVAEHTIEKLKGKHTVTAVFEKVEAE